MIGYIPDKIYLEPSVRNSPVTRNVLERLPQVAVQEIDSAASLLEQARISSPTIPQGKRGLILARRQGRFFKPCPAGEVRGEARNVCCNYFVVNYASNCHLECSYCYLQAYLNFPYLVIYANVEDLLAELDEVLSATPDSAFRIGTGELADSLALDPLTGYSRPLVEFFAGRDNALLEFKTKSDCVDRLLDLDHRGRTVVSWSINPRFIQQTEEHKTAGIEERLAAAERCARAGYPVAFHLDPLVFYPDWEGDYRALVGEIFRRLPIDSIAWMSLGALRMTSQLRDVMRKRFPSSPLAVGELVPCEDGKLRYVKPIRRRMYQQVLGWIREFSQDRTRVYACMERPEVWRRVFHDTIPSDRQVGDSLVSGLVRLEV